MAFRRRDPLLGIQTFAREFWPLLSKAVGPSAGSSVQEPVDPPLGYKPPPANPDDFFPYDPGIVHKPPESDPGILRPMPTTDPPEACSEEGIAAAGVRIKNHERDVRDLQELSARLAKASESARAKLLPQFEALRDRVQYGQAAYERDKKYVTRCAPTV